MGWLLVMWKEQERHVVVYINLLKLSILILTISTGADPSPLFKSSMESTRIMKIEFSARWCIKKYDKKKQVVF